MNENFIPVFDLENEESDQYWPLFIPNDKFRDILSSAIDSMNTNNQKNPVWLQGTYGTGKTHATSVIKHLLCDEELPYYDLDNNELTAKLNNFRGKTKVFPVVLKGTSTIGDSRRFTFTIQKAVKDALSQNNMRVAVPSEFENMIRILKEYPLKSADTEGTLLESFAIDEILFRLENLETDILIEIENIFMKKNLNPFTEENIVDWLSSVRDRLNEEYGIDYLMIFWDEFTGALNMLNVEDILLQIQNIAEAKNKGISLFIVSHRTRSTQVNINQEIIDKIMDRFEPKYYSMEPVATYELMERSIGKEKEWENVKNNYLDVISPLIEKISVNDGSKVKNALENLYPIHPYTAYLATFIAQEIGSTERSIFKFLHDDIPNGFKSFINTFSINERYFLTADYLWDFFYADFEQSEDEKISSSVKKYKLHCENLKKENEEYLVIFKVILLLNVLYKIAEIGKSSLAIPSERNIKNVFIGSIYESKVETVLEYIDKNSIINKTPDRLFELTTNTLPPEQVAATKKRLRENSKVKDLLGNKIFEIKGDINKKIIRETEINVRDSDVSENRLIMDIEKGMFKNSGYLHMILFLCKTEEEYIKINKVIKSVSDKGFFKDILVVVSEAIFGEDNYDKYLEFEARAIVAKAHRYNEDVELNNKHAKKYIDDWAKDIKRKVVSWYLNNRDGKLPLSNLLNAINMDLSKSIFYYGFENISETQENGNVWNKVLSKNQAEKFMTANSLEELQDILKGVDKYSLSILKDNNGNYIIDNKLNMFESVPNKHPIKIMQDYVDETLKNAQDGGKFNLGSELMPLIEAPYGLYPNKLSLAALAFILRKYVNRLYDNKGNSIDKTKMKNIVVSIFEFWTKGKGEQDLYIRFGSENERKLGELINDIFNLNLNSDDQSISVIRWNLRHWIKDNKKPLWLLNYSYISKNNSLSDAIDALSAFLKPEDDNIPDNIIQDCYNTIRPLKSDLRYSSREDSDELFNRFMEEFEKYELTPSDVEDIKEYLYGTMPEEIYDWDREKVKNEILNWIIERNKNNNPLKDPCLEVSVENTLIKISLDRNATGNILVNVAGNGYYTEIKKGKACINISGLEEEKVYLATVSYAGDKNFEKVESTVQIKAERTSPELKDPSLKFSVKDRLIEISLDKNATGKILVNVGDKGYFDEIINGKVNIAIDDLEGGKTYDATILYEGDENFKESEINTKVEIKLKDPHLNVSIDNTVVNAFIDSEATGDILVNINNQKFSSKINKGNAAIKLNGLENGTYVATVLYGGDKNFDKSNLNIDIEIHASDPTIDIIRKADAILLKNALISAFDNNDEITPEIIMTYLERMDDDNT